MVRARVLRALGVSLVAVMLDVVTADAQRPDTSAARRVAAAARADSVRPPISPRRAFVYSLIVPGSAQSILGRNRSAALFLLFEGISLSMIRESNADVQEARRTANDSIVVGYEPGSEDPIKIGPRFDDEFVRARRSHLEDWIAVTVLNHLFSGAEAFVAAQLWDVPTQLKVSATPRGALVTANFTF